MRSAKRTRLRKAFVQFRTSIQCGSTTEKKENTPQIQKHHTHHSGTPSTAQMRGTLTHGFGPSLSKTSSMIRYDESICLYLPAMPRKEKKSIKKPKRKNPTTFEPDKAKKRKRQKKLVLGVKNTTGKLFFQIAIPKESNTFFCRRLFSFGFLGDPCAVMPTGFLFVPLHGSSWAFDPNFPLAFC